MGRECRSSEMDDAAVNCIAERLSAIPDLHMPYSYACRAEAVSNDEKQLHLRSLLRRDAAVFLERYGPHLSVMELEKFQVLGQDYEVAWHLKKLRSAASPTAEERRTRATAVKNRRLAYMSRLVQGGQYFSEDEMRLRSPLLHHEYVGRFQDASARAVARPGERFSELLLRRSEEVFIQQQLRKEQEQAGMVEEEEDDDDDDDQNGVSEHEDDEQDSEEEDEEVSDMEVTGAEAAGIQIAQETDNEQEEPPKLEVPGAPQDSAEEAMAVNVAPSLDMVLCDGSSKERMDDLIRVMQEKFLSGGDAEHVNYNVIDNDHTLDDDWLVEMSRDAEEKYFEGD